MKIVNDDGVEIEVYTAEDMQAQLNPLKEAVEKTTAELTETKKALSERSGQFVQFRKLNDEAIEKLSIAERTIYDNQLALEEERNKNKIENEKRIGEMVDTLIRSKAGSDEKLFTKMKDMWSIIGIDAVTPELMETKAKMILGAISTTEPDALASVAGFSGGSWNPPAAKTENDEKSFAETEQGKQGAAELGLILETPKK